MKLHLIRVSRVWISLPIWNMEKHPYLNDSYTDAIIKQLILLKLFHWQFINTGQDWLIFHHCIITSIQCTVTLESLKDIIIYSSEVIPEALRVSQHFSPKAKISRIRKIIKKKRLEKKNLSIALQAFFIFFLPSLPPSSFPGIFSHPFYPIYLTSSNFLLVPALLMYLPKHKSICCNQWQLVNSEESHSMAATNTCKVNTILWKNHSGQDLNRRLKISIKIFKHKA